MYIKVRIRSDCKFDVLRKGWSKEALLRGRIVIGRHKSEWFLKADKQMNFVFIEGWTSSKKKNWAMKNHHQTLDLMWNANVCKQLTRDVSIRSRSSFTTPTRSHVASQFLLSSQKFPLKRKFEYIFIWTLWCHFGAGCLCDIVTE